MKGLRWAQFVLAGTALLAGCKGFWDAPSGGGGGGGGSASGVFYVLNQGKLQVAGFGFTSGSSTPTAISGASSIFAATPLSLAISPDGGYLYVSTGSGIYGFSISSSGALTLLNNSLAIISDLPTAMAVDGTGTWLIESIGGTGVLNAIPVSAGLLDSTRSVQTIDLPNTNLNEIAVSPANSTYPYVFVAMGAGGTEAIPFNAASTANPFGRVAESL